MRCALSVEKEAEAQVLAQRMRELADEEFVEIARLLVSKSEREVFGDTEFELRDIVLKVGAKALEAHLRLKKTAITDAASIARSASKRPNSTAIDPRS
jgi:parvulin-like peptidyl-prolyl isomerase